MRNGIENLGAPDSTIINEEFTLLHVVLLQQSDETPGSEMLLSVKASISGLDHLFLVGGYWSVKGFRLTTMLMVGTIPSHEGNGIYNAKTKLYGLAFANPTSVMKDRVQMLINSQDVGRPSEPLPAYTQQKSADGWLPEDSEG